MAERHQPAANPHREAVAKEMYHRFMQSPPADGAPEQWRECFEAMAGDSFEYVLGRIDKMYSRAAAVCKRMKHKGYRPASEFAPESVCTRCEHKVALLEQLRVELSARDSND